MDLNTFYGKRPHVLFLVDLRAAGEKNNIKLYT
jgi:hypothetical protein